MVDLTIKRALPKLLTKQTTSIFTPKDILGIGKKHNNEPVVWMKLFCTMITISTIRGIQYKQNKPIGLRTTW